MDKKKEILLAIGVLLLGVLVTAGSYSYWTWLSSPNKNVVFNTSKELMEYINYDEGESTFVGDFKVSDSYTDGIYSTISISKKEEASNVNLTATINMDINSIGTNIASSTALKWVVTRGDSTNIGETLSSGNFLGVSSGESMMLAPNIEITTTEEKYTIWIWLDAGENPDSNLTGETLDTVVWTEINQVEGVSSVFEITKLTNNYQIVNATVVNNKNNIVSYAVTSDNVEPLSSNFEEVELLPLVNKGETKVSKIELNEWIEIPEEEQNKIYNFSYIVPSAGTYYLWFKDSTGNVTSNNITINEVYTDRPICTWGEFSQDKISSGETSIINLTCTGDMVGNTDLTTSDITLSNNYVTLSNIEREKIENGYNYKITLTGTDGNGDVTLTLNNKTFVNKYGNGNENIVSNDITIDNKVNITYISDGEINGAIKLENLVTNGDFENGINNWNTVNSTPAVIHSTDGINNTSFVRITPQATYRWRPSSTYQIPLNNIVYTSAYYRKNGGGNTRLLSYNTSTKLYLGSTYFENDTSVWSKVSTRAVNSTTSTEFSTLIYGAGSSYIEGMYTDWDNIMTIDLTNTFGSGNEPTKEWLDKYLPYIDETGSIYTKEENIGSSFRSLPTPTREGYTFDGWYTGENGTGTKITEDSIVPNEDMTYYANWLSVNITYISDGEIDYGISIENLLMNGDFRSAKGWSKSSSSITNTIAGIVNDNVLYIDDTSTSTGYWTYQPIEFISGNKYYVANTMKLTSYTSGDGLILSIRNNSGGFSEKVSLKTVGNAQRYSIYRQQMIIIIQFKLVVEVRLFYLDKLVKIWL